MKIIVAHNFYGSESPSGENEVFREEVRLLRDRGHEVLEFARHSDEIRAKGVVGLLLGGCSVMWNPWSARAMREQAARFRPDIVHVHNTFPLLSPSIFSALSDGCGRVLTLHNYRLLCAAAIPTRNGRVCIECMEKRSAWPAVRHGCYRESRIATIPLAASVALHQSLGTWRRHVDAFVALSEFQRDLMCQSGLPQKVFHVKPNFFPGNPSVEDWDDRMPSVVFAGRLSAEKGLWTLIRAWREWGPGAPQLHIVGDGPLRSELESFAAGHPIKFLGQLVGADAKREIARAKLLVLPSEWFEGFPMVVREAFAFGTPVAASNLGPLPSIVQDGYTGVVFEAGNWESLLNKVRGAWADAASLRRMGTAAHTEFVTKYTEEANYAALMQIYRSAIQERSHRND